MSNSIGDLKNSGLQGNNFPWQLKMLEGLQKIYDEVKKPLTCAEDSISLCDGQGHSLDILPNGSINVNVLNSIPVAIDCNDRISLCVDGAVVNAANSLPVTVVNPLPLEVDINQANDSILIYGFDGVDNQPISVDTNGYVNVNATVTIPTPLPVSQDPTSNPWTVDATDLDIRDLTFATDSVDVTGSDVTVSNTVTVQATALDIRPLTCGDEVSLCANGITVDSGNPLPVDAGSLTPSADGVGMYGSTDGGTNWTAVQVDSNGVVATNSNIIGPLGNQDCDNSVAVSLCTDQAQDLADIKAALQPITTITPNIQISSGDPATAIAVPVYSVTFFNNGSVDVLVSFNGGSTYATISGGTSITMDAGGLNNQYPANTFYYDSFTLNPSGSLIVTYNS